MESHTRTRRMTLKKYGLYMAEMMGKDPEFWDGDVPFLPPAPTNIRDGYEQTSYHRGYTYPDRPQSFPTTVEEGTDITPKPNEDLGAGEYREYYTHKVEKICDVQDTPSLRLWLDGCKEYGTPSVYYG